MELTDYLRVLRRRWRVVVGVTLATLAIALGITWRTTPQYSATSQLFVSTTQNGGSLAYQANLFAQQRLLSYAGLAKTRQLATKVSEALGDKTDPALLQREIKATPVPNAVILNITATDPSPDRARLIARTYAEQLSQWISRLETPKTTVPPPGSTEPVKKKSPIVKVTAVDKAEAPAVPTSPRPKLNILLGLIIGLGLGVGLAYLRELLDNTISSREDLSDATDMPLLGAIHLEQSKTDAPPSETLTETTAWAESFRVLRTNMQYVDVDREQKVLTVTSSIEGEGKSTVAVNLAVTLAMAEHSVCLVDCDLRRPTIASKLGLDQAVGTTNVLVGKLDVDDVLQTYRDTSLNVIACGPIPPNPSELLQTNAMEKLLVELRSRFEIVVLDAPPLLPVTDASVLAAQSDGAVLVIRHGKTTREQVTDSLQRLEAVEAKGLGAVLNMVKLNRANRTTYGYGYGSSYLKPADSKRRSKGAHV